MRPNMFVKLKKIICFCLCGGGLIGGMARGAEESVGYGELSEALVTPHITWAKPYYRGKIKVLVVAPIGGQRDTIELAQRLDLDYTALMTSDYNRFHNPKAYVPVPLATVEKAFDNGLTNDYDVIIAGKVDWRALPQKYRLLIKEKVSKGTGLVCVSPQLDDELRSMASEKADDGGFITAGIPLRDLPIFNKLLDARCEIVELSKFGRGRMAMLPFQLRNNRQALSPTGKDNQDIHYEYYFSYLVKAILWAANKEPFVSVAAIEVPADPAPAEAERRECVVKLKSPRQADVQVRYCVRSFANEPEYEQDMGKVALTEGDNTVRFRLPGLKAGRHFVDFWVAQDGRVINWGSQSVLVQQPSNGVEAITLNQTGYKPGETIRAEIKLKGRLQKAEYLLVEAADNYQRVMFSEKKEGAAAAFSVAFKLDNPLTVLHRLRVKLCRADSVLQDMETEFTVVLPPPASDDFSFIMWDPSTSDKLEQICLRQYRRMGVDTVYGLYSRSAADYIAGKVKLTARAGLRLLPYATSLAPSPGFQADAIRRPCYTDPDYRQQEKNRLTDRVNALAPFSPPAYSLGDENRIGDEDAFVGAENLRKPNEYCRSATCKAYFRTYLQETYGTLERLNCEWSTQYKAWQEIEPISLEQARKSGNYAPWADHRMCMEQVFEDMHLFCQNVITNLAPSARVGFEGAYSTTWYTGYNWPHLMRNHDLINVYCEYTPDKLQKEILPSFARKGQLLGMWTGTYRWQMGEDFMRNAPWESIFLGYNSIWWYLGLSDNWSHSAFTPSLDPLPCLSQASEEILEIKNGAGKLLLTTGPKEPEIALHYSQSSLYAGFINLTNSPFSGNFPAWRSLQHVSQMNFIYFLKDVGVPFRFVSSEQVASGGLKGYKAVILPYSLALSAEESAKIKDYVQAGGVLIADYMPGIMDEHCRKLAESNLAELFKAAEGAFNKYGQGQAIALGPLIGEYFNQRKNGTEDGSKAAILKILETPGVKPEVSLVAKGGNSPARATSVYLFKNKAEQSEYVGVLRSFNNIDDKKTEEVEIRFGSKAFVYDVRQRRCCGYLDRVSAQVAPARALLYARLPYQVKELVLTPGKNALAAGSAVKYKAEIKAETAAGAKVKQPETHVIHGEVYGPDQERLEYCTQNITADNGRCEITIPLGLNARKGQYKVTARDVASGVGAEVIFTLQ